MANKQGQAQAELQQVENELAQVEARKVEVQKLLSASFSPSGRAKYGITDPNASKQYDDEIKQLNSRIRALAGRKNQLFATAYPEDAEDERQQAREDAREKAQAEREKAAEKAEKLKSRQQSAKEKQSWDDDVEESTKATKTGPPENRPKTAFRESKTTSEETVTGGGSTTTKSVQTPEQAEYYRKYQAAQDADQAEFDRKREEYLRSKGLQNATPAQRRAAVNEAQERGELPGDDFEAGASFRAANPPPRGAPSVTTNTPGENTKKTQTTEEREGASANTAGDKVTDAERANIVNENAGISEDAGTGKDVSGNPTAEELTDEEKQNLDQSKNNSTDTDTAVVTPTTTASGSKVTTTSTGQSATKAKEGTLRNAGDVLRSGQATAEISVGNTNEKPTPIKITPNPLHAYATYTYSLSLHLLTPDAYNTLANGGDWLPEAKTIIAGGGRWGTDKTNKNTFTRAAQFKDDFYFDGLSLETIIGLNTQSKGANAIEFKFNIIEPYGFTLINRLLELSIEMNQPNYLTNPYVLQIDFFGNNDAGEPVHPCTDAEGRSLTKFLPCKIVEVLAKVGTAGATYACRAVPYNHSAFAETVGVTPANFEVVANTVGNFFTNDVDDAALVQQAQTRFKQTQDAQRENVAATAQADTPEKKAKAEAQAKKIEANAKAPFTAKSYTGAYNSYQQYLVLNKFCENPVIIKFNIDPEIANSKIVLKESNSVANTPAVDVNNKKDKAAAVRSQKPAEPGSPAVAGTKNDVAKFNVNAGDQILELINKVMRNSEYITNQLKEKDDAIKEGKNGETPTNKDGKPLKWFKVVPQLKLTKFDKIRNDWGSEITYHIIPFKHHNSKHPGVSKSNDNEIRKSLRKKYSYIYSGENNDIIDFALDFNTVFYTAVNVMTENSARFSTAPDGLATDVKPTDNVNSQPDSQISKGVQRNVIHVIGSDVANSGMNASGNPAAQRAADLMKSIYSSARGDMINVQLKIVGDPDFIKTDDVYYNPGNANYPAPDETHAPDGSILTDRGDIFSLLSWRTPSDLDQETGLPDFTRFQNSAFDGVYKIIKVTCNFAKGGFDQTLNMIRYHDGVADIIEETGNVARGKQTADPAANLNETVIKDEEPRREMSSYSYSKVEKERASADTANTEPDAEENDKKAEVAENGEVVDVEQQTTDQSTAKDGTTPNSSNAQAQSPQADGGPPVKNEGGSQPQTANPPRITNRPAGVETLPTGGYRYRGRFFEANDDADMAAKVKAIDTGTKISTTKTDPASGEQKKVDFDGGNPPPVSNDPATRALQEKYADLRSQHRELGRVIKRTETNEAYSDERVGPGGRQKQIDRLIKQQQDLDAEINAAQEELKAKGSGPAE
jgi:hypothetical protein